MFKILSKLYSTFLFFLPIKVLDIHLFKFNIPLKALTHIPISSGNCQQYRVNSIVRYKNP